MAKHIIRASNAKDARFIETDLPAMYREVKHLSAGDANDIMGNRAVRVASAVRSMYKKSASDSAIKKFCDTVTVAILNENARNNLKAFMTDDERKKYDLAGQVRQAIRDLALARRDKAEKKASKKDGKVVKNRKAEPTSLPSTLETGEEGETLAS